MIIRFILITFLTIFLELGFFGGFLDSFYVPELSIPVIVCASLLFSRKSGVILAFILSIILDITHVQSFGNRVLLFFIIAFLIGTYRENFPQKSFFVVIFLTFVSSIVYQLAFMLLSTIQGYVISIPILFKTIFSHEIIFNLIYSYLCFLLVPKNNKRGFYEF